MLRTADEVLAHVARRMPGSQPIGAPERLTGGHLNFVWRVRAEADSFIVKSAPPFVAALPDVPLDPDRILFEARSLELLGPGGRLAALCSSSIRAPTLIDVDAESHVLAMEDLGDLPDLGECLRRGKADVRWGHLLGRFIGKLHAHTAGNAGLAEEFGNTSVQQTRLNVQYAGVGPLLDQAGIAVSPDVAQRAAALGKRLIETGVCLTMGDLWPASILVDDGRLRLVDWEFAHFGRPAQDVAHLLAHFWMHAHCSLDASGARDITQLARAFFASYASAAQPARAMLFDGQFMADCAVHMGAEIVMRTIGPFQRAYLYEELEPGNELVQEALSFAISSIQTGSNALLRSIADFTARRRA